jgi:hypothetical protein
MTKSRSGGFTFASGTDALLKGALGFGPEGNRVQARLSPGLRFPGGVFFESLGLWLEPTLHYHFHLVHPQFHPEFWLCFHYLHL